MWRLSPATYVDRIFSGGGAYRQGGRWNSPGRAVVYMSESLSLSALESLVHMVRLHMIRGYKSIWVDIPEAYITSIAKSELPADWKAVPAPQTTQHIGNNWFDKQLSPALQVPSTVIPMEHNFVLNPSHPEFNTLKIGNIQDFEFDKRLTSIPSL
ncbi:MAG: RES family NAD+ phosphorylase [Desulfobacteraceae bacterium]|nr:RES family NAD+ phosphorylase [Desulfobacteraceae bacterium]